MAKSKRKFHKTTMTIEVLSDKYYEFETLRDLTCSVENGDCLAQFWIRSRKMLDGLQMAKALKGTGDGPEFFNLTEKGEDDEEAEA